MSSTNPEVKCDDQSQDLQETKQGCPHFLERVEQRLRENAQGGAWLGSWKGFGGSVLPAPRGRGLEESS